MFETRRHSAIHLLPLHGPEKAVELPVNLAPNTVFARGRVLGQLSASANEVQTLTVTGGPTGGTVTATVVHPITGQTLTFDLPYNATNATAQASARAVLGANVTVTGGPLPGTPISFTFNNDFGSIPVHPMTVASALSGGTNPAAAIARTTAGATANTFANYNDANSDGTQTARCILSYDCATDAGGNVTLGNGAGDRGESSKDVPAYFIGIFLTTDLMGLDANGVADLGRLLSGTPANGVLSMS